MASTRTYVSLVNDAITEAGEELATFNTGGTDFSTQSDSMMNKFKTWTSRAWRDIQQECFDWEFMSEQGLCNLDPGIMFYTDGTAVSLFSTALANTSINVLDQDGTTALPNLSVGTFTDLTGTATLTAPFGYFNITGSTSSNPLNVALKPGAEHFTITKTSYNSTTGCSLSGSSTPFTTATVKVFRGAAITIVTAAAVNLVFSGFNPNQIVYFESYSPQVLAAFGDTSVTAFVLQILDNSGVPTGGLLTYTIGASAASLNANVTRTTLATNTAYIHSWKSFDFDEETSAGDFQETIEEINPKSFRLIDYCGSNPNGEVPVPCMPWNTFRSAYDLSSAYPGLPRLISEDDTGRWRLYPHPYYTVSMKFDYVRKPQILSAYSDVPRGVDDNYMDIIMWRTLLYYGEYEEQPSIVARSRKRYNDLLSRLEQKNREKPSFKPKRLW